ncbi:YheO-like PAS domain protein [Bacillus sp. M6-12]|uniref:helix-turn-helix transcriptional regulator n=1 Tax=Bacillus sp. M6-12 TaxID=2054166 RepID=UPI000C792F60|nr:PAS domain-containing protein [Bacillus sp. M6-12]PLS16042.1 YheO-like PAS domain protein [Bacillus sp. M6-12]
MSQDSAKLQKYSKLVDFLAEVLGKNHEVVLHDLTNLENSIIAIRNNHISGRQVGGPATNLVLNVVKNKNLQELDFVTNYTGQSKNSDKLQSSTFFIRNDLNNIIGMLCINSDLSAYHQLIDSVKQITEHKIKASLDIDQMKIMENLSSSIEDLTTSSIDAILSTKAVKPGRMTQEEKIDIVYELNKKGVFLLKGAVNEVARILKVSEATLYRYLQKVKEKD